MTIVRMRNRPSRSWDLNNSPFFQEFDRFFNDVASATHSNSGAANYPADLFETNEAIVFEMAVPGVSVEDLDISVEGRQLSIRGQLGEDYEEERRYWLQTIPRGDFNRTVTLPEKVDVETIQATVKNGLLHLVMPKVAEAKVKKIEVTAS